jgi:hypothetical protein
MRLRPLRPCFVVDLDGTLCNVTHRRHWVASNPKNWDAWNAGIGEDTPNQAVLDVIGCLATRFDIVLVSGRGEEYRAQTTAWLRKYGVRYSGLFMRGAGDFRPDDEIKSELADQVEMEYAILGVFDDRQRVVRMWRERGIFVFDVSQGQGEF